MFLVTKNTEFKLDGGTYTGKVSFGNTYEGTSGQQEPQGDFDSSFLLPWFYI